MIKRLFVFIAILFVTQTGFSAIGDWTLYPSYHNATYCQVMGDKIYVLASGSLFSYNKSDNEVFMYDRINALSDIDITHIAYSKESDVLVIVYKNANIDILYKNGDIYNISDFKNKTLPDKTINNINVQNKKAYLSTSFGVVVIDLENLEFENTYNTGHNTYCTYLFGNRLYTGTENGMFSCDTTKNMLDKNNWEMENKYVTNSICELNGKFYLLIDFLGIYKFDTDNKSLKQVIANNGEKYHTIYSTGKEIIATALNKVTFITDENNVNTYTNSESNHILKDGNSYWDCKGYKGLVKCSVKNNEIVTSSSYIIPESPIRNYCEFMKFTDDEKLLVAGGNINFFDITFYDGTLMEYNYKDDKWINFPEDIIKSETGLKYVNICSIDEDPNEKGHYFASSFGYGIYEFRNGKFVKHYNHLNSPLESVVPEPPTVASKYVRVPMVKFDKEGNLWCINTGVKDIVKILKKDGKWVSLNYKDIEYLPTMVNPIIDSRGWLWITSLQGEAGVFCAKTNNTYMKTSDDVTKVWLNKFKNQDGITYDIYQVYALCEDRKGDMWIGTNSGLFIADDFDNLFNNNVFKQIKVPRNDGTGLADYLLSGVYIKSITTDGANRKWIGTNDNGIYLISEDGQETIHHFTTENSLLPSNTIESIAVNDYTGEVFIGTSKGMASYMSDATRPAEKLDENIIHAYPNPVMENYNGYIYITGLTNDCNVKIVDAAGYLINEGTSVGGQYSWNGRNAHGEKVPSGVYYVLTYDENGDEGVATKILITR